MTRSRLARAAAFVAISLLAPMTTQAEILGAQLRVDGMACPFCAFGIEKKLRAVDGVDEALVLLDEGEVQLALSSGNHATLKDFEEAVKGAGFKLSGLRVDVRGSVSGGPGQALLKVTQTLRFRLLEAENGRVQPISRERLDTVLRQARGGMVIVTGTVDEELDGVPGLVLVGAQVPGPTN